MEYATEESNSQQKTDSTVRKLLALAIPTFGQLIAEPAFILIDTAIVGHLGENALAGLALGSTIILTAVGLCIFLAYATTSQVARLFGAGRMRKGLQAGIDSLWLALFIGIILAVLLFLMAEPLCSLLGGKGDALFEGTAYTQAVVLGVPGMLLVYAANGLCRGLQKVKLTLAVAIGGAVLNTILDILFVLVFGWGIAGSGFATFIAQWFMGISLLIPALRWARNAGVTLSPHLHEIASAGRDGLPLFIRTLALRGGIVATVMVAGVIGTEAIASYQVVNATWNFALNILDSIAIAGQTLVGAQLGAGCIIGARQLTKTTMRCGFIAGIVIGALFIMLGMVAPQAFSPNEEVQKLTTLGMIITGIALPLQGWMWATDGILIGAGDFRYLAWTCTIVASLYVGVLALFVFVALPFISNILYAIAILWIAFDFLFMGGRAITNGIRIRGNSWMLDMQNKRNIKAQ